MPYLVVPIKNYRKQSPVKNSELIPWEKHQTITVR